MKNINSLLNSDSSDFLKLIQIADIAEIWVWEVNNEGLYTYSNSYCEQLIGYKPSQVVGKKYFYDFFLPLEKEKLKTEVLKDFKKKKELKKFKNTILSITNQPVVVETSAIPLLDENQNLIGYRGIDINITEKENLIDNLKDSSNLYKKLFNQIPDPVIIFDKETSKILDCNQTAIEKYGYTIEEFKTKTIIQLHSPEDDFDRINKNIQNEGDDTPNEYIHLDKKGNKIFVETHTDLIDYKGRKVWLTLLRDISYRKETELKLSRQQFYLKKAQEIGLIGTWELVLASDKINWTDEVYDIFEIPYETEIKFNTIIKTIHPDDLRKVGYNWAKVRKAGKCDFEFRISFENKIKWVRVKAELSKDKTEFPISVIGVVQDITERKINESDLIKTKERYSTFVNQSTIGIYRVELEKPIDINLDIETQVDQLYQYGYIAECNTAFMEMYNIKAKKDVIGKKLSLLHGENADPVTRGEARKFIEQGYVVQDAETKEFNINGEEIWFSNYTLGIVENSKLVRYWGTQFDITASKILKEHLISNELRLKEAQKIAQIGSWEWDLKNDKFYWSDEMFRIYNLPKQNRPDLEVIRNMVLEEDLSIYDSAFEVQEDGNIKESTEHRIKTKSDELKYLMVRANANFDENKEIIKLHGTTQDVTSIKIHDAVNSARLYLINYSLKHTAEELIEETINQAEKLTQSQLGFYHFFGETIHSIKSENWSTNTKNFIKENISEKSTDHSVTPDIWEECVYTKNPIINNDLISKSSKCNNLKGIEVKRTLLIPILRGKKNCAVLGVGNKITNYNQVDIEIVTKLADLAWEIVERKKVEEILQESENKYRTIVSESPVGILYYSPDGILTDCNKKFAELIGAPISQLIGLDMYNQLTNKKLIQTIKDSIQKGSSYYEDWYTSVAANKTTYVKILFKSITNHLNETIAGLGLVEDITERKKADDELVVAKEKAEKSDKLKSDFLAQMSHEIRTPINTILSYHSLLKEEVESPLNEDIKLLYDGIDSASQRIIRTIDLILNMAEIQSGSYNYNPEKINLEKIVNSLINEMKHYAKIKNLILTLDNKVGDDLLILADQYSIKQIIANLIDNAIKYTNEGQITIDIEKSSNNLTSLKVKDTGIGISDEYIETLFEPFSQEEQGYTRRFEGNGLGLALVKKYCEINDVSISVKSQKDIGSEFELVFKSMD